MCQKKLHKIKRLLKYSASGINDSPTIGTFASSLERSFIELMFFLGFGGGFFCLFVFFCFFSVRQRKIYSSVVHQQCQGSQMAPMDEKNHRISNS